MGDDTKGQPTGGWPDKHMLEAAMGLLASAVAFDPATGWDNAKQDWMDAYHRHLAAARQSPRGIIRGVRDRFVAAGGPQALARIAMATIDSALAVLTAVVPGKTPDRPRG